MSLELFNWRSIASLKGTYVEHSVYFDTLPSHGRRAGRGKCILLGCASPPLQAPGSSGLPMPSCGIGSCRGQGGGLRALEPLRCTAPTPPRPTQSSPLYPFEHFLGSGESGLWGGYVEISFLRDAPFWLLGTGFTTKPSHTSWIGG